jgi:hypothetical protein
MNIHSPEIALSTSALVAAIEKAHDAARNLVEQRLAAKLSSSRPAGVARELRELLKVMSNRED